MYEPYETHEQTNGLYRGFDQAKPLQAEFYSAQVLPARRIHDADRRNKSARTWRQPCTGSVKTYRSNDDDFLAGKPVVFKWLCYIGFALMMSGVLPMAACSFLFWFFDTFDCWWVEIPMLIGVMWLLIRSVGK